jgi:PAS domain S-box-containing protein
MPLLQGFNKCASSLFGYEESEVLGEDIHILIPEHLREAHKVLASQLRHDVHVLLVSIF